MHEPGDALPQPLKYCPTPQDEIRQVEHVEAPEQVDHKNYLMSVGVCDLCQSSLLDIGNENKYSCLKLIGVR